MQKELNLGIAPSKKTKFKMAELSKREREAILLAWSAATISEDPHVKVGACAIRTDNSVAGVGYNGPPPGVEIDWRNRAERRKYIIHAEKNALAYTAPGECLLIGVTLFPCHDCLNEVARYGIKTIIFADFYDISSGYGNHKEIFDSAEKYGIEIKQAINFHQWIKGQTK